MNQELYNRLIMENSRKKFYGHDKLKSKYTPRIPVSSEREYQRVINEYMGILKDALEEELPKIKETYRKEYLNSRNDSIDDLANLITNAFNSIGNKVLAQTERFGLKGKLDRIARINRKLTVTEWKRVIKNTLGVNIKEDYYLGDFYEAYLNEWVAYNVGLIKTIPEEALGKMREIVYEGFDKGKTTTEMVKDIKAAYGTSKKHAKFIAKDQIAKMYSELAKAQQEDAGVEEYIWCTVSDERVRESHKELDGKRFRWDDPPTNSDGRTCHPGEDYYCRCIARPILNLNMNLPIEEGELDEF